MSLEGSSANQTKTNVRCSELSIHYFFRHLVTTTLNECLIVEDFVKHIGNESQLPFQKNQGWLL